MVSYNHYVPPFSFFFFLILTFDFYSLVTEWRISKRVEEQFNAFITGFNELIPPDLVNVFDERELELLIGGIADIDVDDWKKHTDYRGYTETDEVIVNFWKVLFRPSFSMINCKENLLTNFIIKSINSAFVAGTLNKNQGFYNSRQAPLVSPSTDSRTSKAAMAHADSRLRKRANSFTFLSRIHGISNPHTFSFTFYPLESVILQPLFAIIHISRRGNPQPTPKK